MYQPLKTFKDVHVHVQFTIINQNQYNYIHILKTL